MSHPIPMWLKATVFLGLPLGLVLAWGSGNLYHRVGPGRALAAEAHAPHPVKVLAVGRQASDATLALPGTVVADATAVVAAQLMATLQAVDVQEGDAVRAGQALATLDARDLEARLAQASAGAGQARAAAEAARQAVAAALGGLERARAHHDTARTTLERMRKLRLDGGAAPQDLTEAEGAARMAGAELEQARRQVDAARAQQAQALAAAQQGDASVRLARTERSYAALVAPFAGTVVKRWLDPGALATPGRPVLEIERGPFRLDVPVEARFAATLAPGQAVTVSLDAPAREVPAHVARVVPAVDPGSRTALVKVALGAVPGLRSGTFGRAAFPAGQARRLLVPAGAVVRWYNLTSAFVVDGEGRVELRLVRLGEAHDGRFEVLDGLADGDRVVTTHTDELRDGMKVEVAS